MATNNKRHSTTPPEKNAIKYNKSSDNFGYLYESQISTVLASRLINDPNVEDFWLISNPYGITSFDDIILKVRYRKPTARNIMFLIQAKHTNKQLKFVDESKKTTKEKHVAISLKKFEESYTDICDLTTKKEHCLYDIFKSVPFSNYYFCIFTVSSDIEPTLDDLNFEERYLETDLKLLDIAGNDMIKQFKKDVQERYHFMQKVFFVTQQPCSSKMYSHINLKGFSNSMKKSLCSNIADHLKAKGVCNPLTKSIFIAKTTEIFLRQNLSQYMIQTSPILPEFLPFWRGITSKYQFINISKETGKELLPLVAHYYEERIKALSNHFTDQESVFQDFNWNECVKNCFQLDYQRICIKNVENLIDLLLYMWEHDDLPLLIGEEIAEMTQAISESGKRFIVMSTKKLALNEKVLNTTYDLKNQTELFKYVMDMKFSLQGRAQVSLDAITNQNDDVLKSMTISDVLRWTGQNNRSIGSPIQVSTAHYIARKFKYFNQYLNEVAILKSVESNKLIIISNDAGMGKSTVLQSLALKSNKQYFVVLYNLANCRQDLADGNSKIHTNPIQFLYENMEKKRNLYIDAIFKQHLSERKLMVYIDSFDELLPYHEEEVLDVIQKIINCRVPVVITTRTQAEHKLVDRFGGAVLKLTPLTPSETKRYCEKAEIKTRMLRNIPERILEVPLYLNMLVRVENDTIDNKTKLFNHFFNEMIGIYYHKIKIQEYHVHNRLTPYQEFIMDSHTIAALVYIFGLGRIKEMGVISEREWTKILEEFKQFKLELGIILEMEPDVQFRHKTFAEYLVAKYISKNMHDHHTKILYEEIVKQPVHREVYTFLNEMRLEKFGRESIHMAISSGDWKQVEELCITDLDVRDKTYGMYPIHFAAVRWFLQEDERSIEVLKVILKHETTMDRKDDILKWHWTDFLVGDEVPKLRDVPPDVLCDCLAILNIYWYIEKYKFF